LKPLLLAAAVAFCAAPAAGTEVEPTDVYVAATTILGAAGGALAGGALGGISRTDADSNVRPYLRWGAMGATFGALIGYDVGRDLTSKPRDREDLPPPPTREMGACLGAILGEGLGFGAAAAIMSANHTSLKRNSREMWTGVSVGALLGAAGGFLMKPVHIIPPPSNLSRERLARAKAERSIEPLVPVKPEARDFMNAAEPAREKQPEPSAALTKSQLHDLEVALLEPEQEAQLKKPEPLGPLGKQQLLLSSLPSSHEAAVQSRSVLLLGQVAGLVLGGAAGGSVSGDPGGFYERVALGGGVGVLAGWSASSALGRSWRSPEPGSFSDAGEIMAQGNRVSGTLAGGLIGAALGGILGSILQGTTTGFDRTAVSRSILVGDLLGLFAGSLLMPSGD